MRECWLKTNRRVIAIVLVAPLVLLAGGLGLALGLGGHESFRLVSWIGWLLAAVGAAGVALLLVLFFQPRLGFARDRLMVYLGTPRPLEVPIELIECFFLGHGPSGLPTSEGQEPETQTIVVRLAESAAEWKHREVKPALGHWCDGYIVIRGTWCEPISAELVNRLNARLVEAHRRRKQARELETA